MKKRKIRIGVAIDENGDWVSYGMGHGQDGVEDDGDMLLGVEEGTDHDMQGTNRRLYIVEAELPIPEAPEVSVIKGNVILRSRERNPDE